MSVLSSVDLKRMYPESRFVGPASVDLHIGDTLLCWPSDVVRDPRRADQSAEWLPVPIFYAQDEIDEPLWLLTPGVRYLATTRETITILPEYAGQIAARSSWGRDGLSVICGPAGWIDPGYEGRPTLELSVVGSQLVIWPGARVAQLILHELTTPCDQPYSGKYRLDSQPTPSRAHLDPYGGRDVS